MIIFYLICELLSISLLFIELYKSKITRTNLLNTSTLVIPCQLPMVESQPNIQYNSTPACVILHKCPKTLKKKKSINASCSTACSC